MSQVGGVVAVDLRATGDRMACATRIVGADITELPRSDIAGCLLTLFLQTFYTALTIPERG